MALKKAQLISLGMQSRYIIKIIISMSPQLILFKKCNYIYNLMEDMDKAHFYTQFMALEVFLKLFLDYAQFTEEFTC